MKKVGPGLAIAFGLLFISNTWVLVHVAANRRGTPEAELELTSRELASYPRDSEDSSVMLELRWNNPAPEYSVNGAEPTGWFDERKLREIGFDLRVPVGAADAERYYLNQRSRDVYVALELAGASWEKWLALREQQFRLEPSVGQTLTIEQRLEVERSAESRLVAVDASVDPIALRRAHPDRRHVLILPGLARVVRDEERPGGRGRPPRPAALRGAISRLTIEQVNVPQPLSGVLTGQSAMPWSLENGALKIQPTAYSATLAVGSRYEPWIVSLKPLP